MAGLDQCLAKLLDGTAFFPLIHRLASAIGKVSHPLCVRPGAIGFALDQRRAAPLSRLLESPPGCLFNLVDVVAVDFNSAYAELLRTLGDIRVAAGIIERHLGGELIVLADEQDRQFPDGGHVESLMEGAVVHGSIPEKRHGHVGAVQQLETVSPSTGL